MKKILIVFLLGLLLGFTGCFIDVKNRVKITGGTYRIVTYSQMENDSVKSIRPANENDTVLGLGISFKTSFFADGTEQTMIINTHTQGEKGPTDTIRQIIISSESNELQKYMYNDTTSKSFLMNGEDFIEYSEYTYTNWKKESYSTFTFSDITDFIDRYNKRAGTFTAMHNLDREIFFWFTPNEDISYSALDQLEFKVHFTDGRVVELIPYRKQ